MGQFWRNGKNLSENIEFQIAPDKANHMIPTVLGFLPKAARDAFFSREPQVNFGFGQRLQRRIAFEFAVPVATVVPLFERQGFPFEFIQRGQVNLGEKFLLIMVIELFYHAIAPGFRHRDEPGSMCICRQSRISGPMPRGYL